MTSDHPRHSGRLAMATRQEGASSLEFAIVGALFITILFLFLQVGVLMRNMGLINMATIHGARLFASLRGFSNPVTTVVDSVRNRLVPNMAPLATVNSNTTITLAFCQINGTSCTTCFNGTLGTSDLSAGNTACKTQFDTFDPTKGGDLAKLRTNIIRLTLSYNMAGTLKALPLASLASITTLTQQSSEPIQ